MVFLDSAAIVLVAGSHWRQLKAKSVERLSAEGAA